MRHHIVVYCFRYPCALENISSKRLLLWTQSSYSCVRAQNVSTTRQDLQALRHTPHFFLLSYISIFVDRLRTATSRFAGLKFLDYDSQPSLRYKNLNFHRFMDLSSALQFCLICVSLAMTTNVYFFVQILTLYPLLFYQFGMVAYKCIKFYCSYNKRSKFAFSHICFSTDNRCYISKIFLAIWKFRLRFPIRFQYFAYMKRFRFC